MPLIDLEEGGGGIQSFTGTIVEAYFTENEYGLSLMLKSQFDDPENYVRFEDGCFTRYFPCGKGWTTSDGGETATHPDGDTKKFNTASKVGQLCGALNAVPGIEDAVDSNWSAYVAKSWQGLHLTWGQVPVKKRKPKTDETGADVLDANGKQVWVDVDGATELLPVAVAGGVQAPVQTALIDTTTFGLDAVQTDALTVLAQAVDTDAKFIEGVTKIDGVMANKAFMAAMASDVGALRAAYSEPF